MLNSERAFVVVLLNKILFCNARLVCSRISYNCSRQWLMWTMSYVWEKLKRQHCDCFVHKYYRKQTVGLFKKKKKKTIDHAFSI